VSTVAGRMFEPAGRRSLKGFSEPVRLWSLTR
jgi:class 3 adenylate cyclase